MTPFNTLNTAGQRIFLWAVVLFTIALVAALATALRPPAVEVRVSVVTASRCGPPAVRCTGLDFSQAAAAAERGAVALHPLK